MQRHVAAPGDAKSEDRAELASACLRNLVWTISWVQKLAQLSTVS